MSERQINDPQPAPQAPASVDLAAQQLASARRRRFIKMGAGAVPVALTLASRPVMATNCMSASAWGSNMGVTTTSQYAHARKVLISGTYTLTTWKTAGCGGWTSTAITANSKRYDTYTVTDLCGTNIPKGTKAIAGNSVVSTILKDSSYSEFQRAMLVAWLNYKVSSSVQSCVVDSTRPSVNQLAVVGAIPTIGGTGPDGKFWTQAKVVDYLTANYLYAV